MVVDDLLSGRHDAVRIVVSAGDARAASLPFELLQWPASSVDAVRLVTHTGPPTVSIVRESVSDVDVRVTDWLPRGRFRSLLVASPAGLAEADEMVGRAAAGLEPSGQGVEPPQTVDPRAPELAFRGDAEALGDLIRERQPELLVLFGHGLLPDTGDGEAVDDAAASATAGPAWLVGELGRHAALDAAMVAGCVATAPPQVAVLAMCHSATPVRARFAWQAQSPHQDVTMCALVSRRADVISVGFVGDVPVDRMIAFIGAFDRRLHAAAAVELNAALPLQAVEDAVRDGRSAMGDLAHLPVIHVPASALAGRRRLLARVSSPTSRVAEIPWAVVGQMLVLRQGDLRYRMPVPVDPGYRVGIELVDRTLRVDGLQSATPGLVVALLGESLEQWGVDFVVSPQDRTSRPVTYPTSASAEAAAIVRGVHQLLGSPSEALISALAGLVDDDWGTYDARPWIIEVGTGRAVRGFDRWPELYAHVDARSARHVPVVATSMIDLENQARDDRSALLTLDDETWTEIERAFEDDPQAVLDLATKQRDAWLRADQRPTGDSRCPIWIAVALRSEPTTVCFPRYGWLAAEPQDGALPVGVVDASERDVLR